MFREKFLAASLFIALMVIGLVACSKSPVDQIIDRGAFLVAQSKCSALTNESPACVLEVFAIRARDYCANNGLSPGNPKCIELQEQVKKKVVANFAQNVKDTAGYKQEFGN
jgi:hypothetical protein